MVNVFLLIIYMYSDFYTRKFVQYGKITVVIAQQKTITNQGYILITLLCCLEIYVDSSKDVVYVRLFLA